MKCWMRKRDKMSFKIWILPKAGKYNYPSIFCKFNCLTYMIFHLIYAPLIYAHLLYAPLIYAHLIYAHPNICSPYIWGTFCWFRDWQRSTATTRITKLCRDSTLLSKGTGEDQGFWSKTPAKSSFISTEGTLRRPMTYDNQSHPSVCHKASESSKQAS